ncbi:DUF4269 domain-containing protein [Sphingobacterium olei]|uniref:DUF4269 domain-containing protein n=1 Tax=Sphingobacterium olei TaxID=2571155 RepID=A0A4U0NHX1_9SPHI|nr:DUF4269 domain-containing protein [Sphingobacterium olei]TJZ53816.1 DUF4269 domain-containing protein [Sphingobacterium olei]
MAINFDKIEYLQYGNNRQRQAYSTLTNNKVMLKLEHFDPILVGTIPINIDIENSDLDIICCFTNKQEFQKSLITNFSDERNFTIGEQQSIDTLAIVANFVVDNFEIEIFGQSIPTKQQFAYRHLIVEHNLLNKHGEKFRQEIIKLKRQGHKTEPAFGLALGLTGDPYTELLKFEATDKSPNR